jgi:hypothetical protein
VGVEGGGKAEPSHILLLDMEVALKTKSKVEKRKVEKLAAETNVIG